MRGGFNFYTLEFNGIHFSLVLFPIIYTNIRFHLVNRNSLSVQINYSTFEVHKPPISTYFVLDRCKEHFFGSFIIYMYLVLQMEVVKTFLFSKWIVVVVY